jgi:vancomycin resistance protein YoaR
MTKKYQPRLPLTLTVLASVIVIGTFVFSFMRYYQDRFLPGTSVFHTDISHLTVPEAVSLLQQQYPSPPDFTIAFTLFDASSGAVLDTLASPSAAFGIAYDFSTPLTTILTHQQPFSLSSRSPSVTTSPLLYLDSSITPNADCHSLGFTPACPLSPLQVAQNYFHQPGIDGSISFNQKTDAIVVQPGQDELQLNLADTSDQLYTYLNQTDLKSGDTLVVPITRQHYSGSLALTPTQVAQLSAQATSLISKKLTLTTSHIPQFSHTLTPAQLIPLLGPDSSTKSTILADTLTAISPQVERPPQEPVFLLDASSSATTPQLAKFTPPQDGLSLTPTAFATILAQGIDQLLATPSATVSIELPLTVHPPTTPLSATNTLGINELIGFGESYYAGSIPGRIHNVALAASRINGTLIPPAGEFSFNRVLGEVSGATGFKAGYIIQGGRSVLSDGGGVCQVSTTVFRALLDSGLQITRRLPHSYRVSYYELNDDPGFDATVYSGNVDLRFVNDTDHYVLLTTTTDSNALYMTVKLYGTSDGRHIAITNYTKSNYTSPPPPEYIPDPALPPGARQQIDWAVAGLSTNFTHTIYNADGSIRSQTQYPSRYQAWSSKYLVGP